MLTVHVIAFNPQQTRLHYTQRNVTSNENGVYFLFSDQRDEKVPFDAVGYVGDDEKLSTGAGLRASGELVNINNNILRVRCSTVM